MIEHAHEDDPIELLAELAYFIDGEPVKFNVRAHHLGREPRLREIALVVVDRDYAVGAAPLHFERIEAGVAADIEHCFPAQIPRNRMLETLPLEARIVTEKMVRRGLDAVEIEIVKLVAEL